MNKPTLGAGIVAIVFGLLMFVPVIVLGAAIDWPASLSEPGTTLMPLIADNAGAVAVGYAAYLVYSLLFFPAVLLLARVAGDSQLARAAVVLAAVSALARTIGIIRWLTVLPELAADGGDPATFDVINRYGGAIGELLGVSAFGAGAIVLVGIAMLRSRAVPRWVGFSSFAVATGLLLPWIEVGGIDLGPIISVSVALLQIWFLALGTVLLLKARALSAGTHA